MKKAIQVNIHDRIFYIDEDAYSLLQNYLHQLSTAFPDAEGQEIVSDIETRISELFDERCSQGYNVIDIAYVNTVIDTVGRPEELSDTEYISGNEQQTTPPPFANAPATETPKKKLYRDVDNKVFGGVLSGLAKYLNWDVNVLRFLVVLLVICTLVAPWALTWPWLIAYLVCWMVIPPADTPRRKLEMEGREVTVENIGNNVRERAEQNPNKPSGSFGDALGNIASALCKIILAVIGVIAGFVCLSMILGFLFFLFVVAGLCMFGIDQMATAFDTDFAPVVIWQCILSLLMILGGVLLVGTIVWAICSVLFNWSKVKKSTWISLVIMLIIIAGAATLIAFRLSGMGYTLFPFD